LEKKRKED
jgi:hypothetical protein